jgi:hypothetical protein
MMMMMMMMMIDDAGRYINAALMRDLSTRHGLANATDVIITGCSAGALQVRPWLLLACGHDGDDNDDDDDDDDEDEDEDDMMNDE